MGLMIKTQRDGKLRTFWYGVHTPESGKRVVVNLAVRIRGTPPASGSLKDVGDAEFEASRRKALHTLEEWQRDAKQKGQSTHLVERLIETKTGRAVEHVKLADLEGKVEAMRRSSAESDRPCEGAMACRYFAEFMATRRAQTTFLYEVTPEDAAAFHTALMVRFSPRTVCGYTNAVRSAFARWLPEGASNPFRDVRPKGATDQVHRKPFSPDELKALLDAARPDELLFPLVTACVCTGLRKGDVCRLKWSDVDLDAGAVSVRTSKTGEPVEIPLFAPLREVLVGRRRNGGKLVFPEAAEIYEKNDTRLTYLFKRLIAQVFGEDAEGDAEETVEAAEIAEEGVRAVLENCQAGPRRERILNTFRRYCEGQGFRTIQAETGRVRSTISADLHAVEDWTGKRFLRWAKGDTKAAIARTTRETRERGTRAASVRDWHALRVTFCTIALSAGVPIELVKRITGHKTAEIVMRHYFRPGREEFRAALAGALPSVLTGEAAPSGGRGAGEVAALAEKVAAGSASEAEKARLGELLRA